jgi:hypothetical protein
MERYEFSDRLEMLGVLGGGFVIITALGTLAGLPWTTTTNTAAALVGVLGVFLTLALGVVVIAITYDGSPGDLIPGGEGTD